MGAQDFLPPSPAEFIAGLVRDHPTFDPEETRRVATRQWLRTLPTVFLKEAYNRLERGVNPMLAAPVELPETGLKPAIYEVLYERGKIKGGPPPEVYRGKG